MKKRTKSVIWAIILIASVLPDVACTQVKTSTVMVSKDIEYIQVLDYQGKMQSLRLDTYQQPKGNKTNRPVIILVHGGGFGGGDKGYTEAQGNFYPEIATAFANEGYVVFSINYRLCSDCPDSFNVVLDNAVADALAALSWIKNKRLEYGIDTTKIIIGGDSAGGGLVVNASYRYADSQLFAGCIDLWGGLAPFGVGLKSVPVNACPVTTKTPPTCIIHGTIDSVVPYSISMDLSALLTSKGIYNELHPLEGAEHYPNHLSGQIIQIMLAFSNKIISR